MNEFLYVSFYVEIEDREFLELKLENLGNDFVKISDFTPTELSPWVIIDGKINSSIATMIKLSDPFLAERMLVSIIDNNMKDKYRK